MNWWILNLILWCVVVCGAAYGVVLAARAKRLNAGLLNELAARKREVGQLAHGLRLFAIRGHWTVDGGRGKRPEWTEGSIPWSRAQRALGDHWRPGKDGGE